jgi:hypothetical protein
VHPLLQEYLSTTTCQFGSRPTGGGTGGGLPVRYRWRYPVEVPGRLIEPTISLYGVFGLYEISKL